MIAPLLSGTTWVEVEFEGQVNDTGVRGFHLSPLGDGRLYTTYLEPAAARRVFPCFDRPDAKAVFEIEVTAPEGLTVVSNSPVADRQPQDGGRQRTRFEPTPPMSTYLLYLGIGPLEEIHGTVERPRVILAAAPGQAAHGRFAVAQAERALEFFARYYAEPYPLPKLHLVAVPQFGTGAMENWGAIAFQEYLLLYGDRAPLRSRIFSVEVICHEIAHQWFGDLVTMRWWNDLWLNESFATFVAAKASDALFPEWHQEEELVTARLAAALFWDAMPRTHPVRVEVHEPNQIRQIFDDISYGKGAAVLRMAESFVGEDAFRQGVSAYLGAHRYANADASDLWRAIGDVAGPGVERMFAEWVERPGEPVVTATVEGDRLHLSQDRFTLLEPATAAPWPIPLSVRDDRTVHRQTFDTRVTTVRGIQGVPVVNPDRTGFYRVRYAGDLRDQVGRVYPRLTPLDRWGLQDDSLAFLLAGSIPLEEYLSTLRRMNDETDPLVLSALEDLTTVRYPLVCRVPQWKETVRALVVAQSERLGLARQSGEPARAQALREAIQGARVLLDPAFARRLAAMYPELDRVDPDLVRPVLRAHAATAGPAEYRELRSRLAAATTGEERGNVAGALGVVPRSEWVREGLDMLGTGELLLGPWARLMGSAALANPDCARAIVEFLNEPSQGLFARLAGTGSQGPMLQLVFPAVGASCPAEIRAFLASHEFPDAARAVANSLDLLTLYERLLRSIGAS